MNKDNVSPLTMQHSNFYYIPWKVTSGEGVTNRSYGHA